MHLFFSQAAIQIAESGGDFFCDNMKDKCNGVIFVENEAENLRIGEDLKEDIKIKYLQNYN